MTPDETLYRALNAIAGTAPDPDRVRQRIAGRIRTQRQRRALVMTGAAAAGVAAVAVPSVVWLYRGQRTQPTDGNVPSPTTEPTHSGNLRAPMRLRPTWLPDGVFEISRSATVGSAQQERIWATDRAMELQKQGKLEQSLAEAIVSLRISHPVPFVDPTPATPDPASPPPSPQPFEPLGGPANSTIGGRPALLNHDYNGQSTVTWLLDDSGIVASMFITSIPDSLAVVERVARSMVPDTTAVCETSLRFGWLPGQASAPEISISGWHGGWAEALGVGQINGTSPGADAILASSRDELSDPAPPGFDDDTALRGRPGKAGGADDHGEARVELDGGRWLKVVSYYGASSGEQLANVIRVTNELVIGPDPYLGWIGMR